MTCVKEFFIPYNCPSSKNGKTWTGRFLVWSKTSQKYRKDTKQYWDLYRDEFLAEATKHVLPLRLSFHYIRGTKHKFDYVNPLQTTLDLMVENGWIPDDNADVVLPVFERYSYSKQNPGVIIKILNNEV